ncbi:MAG: aminotransferase class I/II-fold pyridoxal phosphate-dependent enzyme [Anaerolineae bacterium]
MQTLLDPGDEVLALPDSYYTVYEMAIGLVGGVVVRVPTLAERNFEVQAADIEARITPRTPARWSWYRPTILPEALFRRLPWLRWPK